MCLCQSHSDRIRAIAQLGKPSRLRAAPVRPVIGRLSDGGRCNIHLNGGRCQLPSDGGSVPTPIKSGGRCQTDVTRLESVQSVVKLTTVRPHVDTPRKLCAESAVNQATKTNITLVIRTSAYKNGLLIYIQTYCVTCNNARLR